MLKLPIAALSLIVVALLVPGCRREAATPGQGGAAGKTGSPAAGEEDSSGPATAELGQKMPEYRAITLEGKPYNLSDRRDKVVLLNIWATWCGPCRYEIPELQALHDRLSPRGLEVLGVSIDDPGQEGGVRDFVNEQKITYPVVLDPEGKIADLFQTTVIPTSALVNRDGTILWKHRGIVSADDAELQAALQKALGTS